MQSPAHDRHRSSGEYSLFLLHRLAKEEELDSEERSHVLVIFMTAFSKSCYTYYTVVSSMRSQMSFHFDLRFFEARLEQSAGLPPTELSHFCDYRFNHTPRVALQVPRPTPDFPLGDFDLQIRISCFIKQLPAPTIQPHKDLHWRLGLASGTPTISSTLNRCSFRRPGPTLTYSHRQHFALSSKATCATIPKRNVSVDLLSL